MPEKDEPTDTGNAPNSMWAASGKYAGLGLQLAASIGLFLWLGWVADHRLGTTPLFTIIGAFVGAGGGFYSLYRQLVLDPPDGNGSNR